MRGLRPAAFVIAAFSTLSAQQPASVRLIAIDVVAADAAGRAVDTLKTDDFKVTDAGAAQALESARLVTGEPRLFAIYLDEYHVAAGDADRVRAALTGFLDRDLQPRDEVAIMKPLDSLFAIKSTSDREAARAIVGAFVGRKGDLEPRTSYERNFIAGTPARIESARTQVAWSAINALAVHLGGSDGGTDDRRRTLIVVADGLARPDRVRGETLPTPETATRSANKRNVAVYALDPRALANDDAPDALRALAADTDGRAIAGDLAAGLDRAAADAASYYLLTYHAASAEDGRFHPVDVRVTRRGVDLHARKGYYSPSPDDALRAAVLASLNAPKITKPPEPAPHVSTLIKPWFGMSRGSDGRTRVTFVWEPAGRVPGERGRAVARTPSRIVLTALGGDGTVLFEGPVLPTGPSVVEADAAGGTPVRAVFDAAPGRLKLRMAIQDSAEGVLDRDVRDISVRDLRGPVAIGTPEVLRSRNAREFRALDASAAVPIVSREFSRMERLLIRVPVYGGDGVAVALSATLVSGMGNAMRALTVTSAPRAGGLDEIDLPLSGLAAGEYLIDLTATSGGKQARDRLSIRVTP